MKVGTRDSELAMRQTEIFIEALKDIHPEAEVEIVKIRSSGDLDLKSPLDKLQGFGAFVRELDMALLNGEIDVAVNSMKDMPIDLPDGLSIPAVLPRADVRDVCMPRPFEGLEMGATVGTSSIRRSAIIRSVRPDIKVKVLRGNVRTRMSKLDSGEYDAIILAKAGMDRLDVKRPMYALDPDTFVPAPAQGTIAVVCRSEDREVVELLSQLDDVHTRTEVDTERRLMKILGAGCSSPVGINVRKKPDGRLFMRAVSFGTGVRASFEGEIPVHCSETILSDVARRLSGDPVGHVYLVGAGPGDIGLITVKGLELLRAAEVVVYDALADRSLLNECSGAEFVDVGKRSNDHTKTQDEINQILVDYARKGKIVVRLKGGDPFLFGRGAEEAAVLRGAGVPVSVVPGVSSSIAVPEIAGVPVTHRDWASSVTILTGHGKRGSDGVDWRSSARINGTLVILMGMDNAGSISAGLIEGGRPPDTPVAVITDGSRPEQRTAVTTLGGLSDTISSEGLKAPGIIVIGGVVSERAKLGDLR